MLSVVCLVTCDLCRQLVVTFHISRAISSVPAGCRQLSRILYSPLTKLSFVTTQLTGRRTTVGCPLSESVTLSESHIMAVPSPCSKTLLEAVRTRASSDAMWLAKNRRCFAEPALTQRRPIGDAAGQLPTSWQEYWRWRGWDLHATRTLGDDPALHAPFYRQLSAMITFPMTLAHVLSRRFRYGSVPRRDHLNIVVLGARAEATLPPSAWLELAHALPCSTIFLRMVGPAVDSQLAMAASREAWHAEGVRASLHRGFYHQLKARSDCSQLIGRPDAFVLFHPGLMHEGWQMGWRRTFQSVLETNAPVIVTGFSLADSRANMRFIEEEQRKWTRTAHAERLWTNPFASQRLLLDEKQASVMQANQSFVVLSGAGDSGSSAHA